MANDYKETLNLPKTDFQMKGNLVRMEPEILKFWDEINLNERLIANADKRPKFVLHDGPPYANGDIHLGHTLNKVLKDMIVKYKNMTGYYSPYVPGWDCHGQPIEHEVEKRLGRERANISQADLRTKCRDYALKYVDRQRQQFIRLGVTGDWKHPYLTLDLTYEATNVRVFNRLYQEGLIYKGKKPIHWCWSCQTALAEAEIEYADERSPSIYVKFPLISEFELLSEYRQPKSLLIWTTTPWTLPANVAIAVHPSAPYAAVISDSEIFIVAASLVEGLSDALEQPVKILTTFEGGDLKGQLCRHPIFDDKTSIVVTAEYVALDQGTGCVHIAPGHGAEDYAIGLLNKLPSPMPVNDRGVFTEEAGRYGGKHIFEANEMIIDDLIEKGLLIHQDKISHSYPHCWRCKNPVIFRATEQWFISMESRELRSQALTAIQEVYWIPGWSINRISAMVSERPDWCISRQRAWGVPIPVFYCNACNQIIADREVLDFVESVFKAEGADSWFTKPVEDLLPKGVSCPNCGGTDFRAEKDILDVWFESGVSHEAVLKTRDELSWPADLYLEGSDQHRGWFQSSLLTSVGVEKKAPYRHVLTHGFLVDGEGRKMSKSLGNVIDPLQVIERSGADILRLWVSSSDYGSDIAISEEILQRITEAYRRIRNTIRFLLGNLVDFDLQKDGISYNEMVNLDRWALLRLNQLIERCRDSYDEYRFYLVYHSIYNFCNVDLSAFYLDILKDRLYTFKAESRERRSAQTALAQILVELLKLLAPIIAFTAEEAWRLLPESYRDADSVHLSTMPTANEDLIDPSLEQDLDRLLQLRGEVAKALEKARNEKIISSSLEAKLELYLPETLKAVCRDYLSELAAVFIISQLEIMSGRPPANIWRSDIIPGLAVNVSHAAGNKCARCWNWRLDVGVNSNHPLICGRCAAAIGV